jgi:hypothetical protein
LAGTGCGLMDAKALLIKQKRDLKIRISAIYQLVMLSGVRA